MNCIRLASGRRQDVHHLLRFRGLRKRFQPLLWWSDRLEPIRIFLVEDRRGWSRSSSEGSTAILKFPWTRDWSVKPRLFFDGGRRALFGSYERRSCKYPVSCTPSIIVQVFISLHALLGPRLAFFSQLLLLWSFGLRFSLGNAFLQTNFEKFGEVLLDPLQLLRRLPFCGNPLRSQTYCFIAAFQVLQCRVSFLSTTHQLGPRTWLDGHIAFGHIFRDIFPNTLHNGLAMG